MGVGRSSARKHGAKVTPSAMRNRRLMFGLRLSPMPCQTLRMPASIFNPPLSVDQAETPFPTSIWDDVPEFSPAELARRERDSLRLKQAFSSIPCHAARAAEDPDYWRVFLMSAVNKYSVPDSEVFSTPA